MTSSRKNDLPPGLSSMWRLCKLGYRHEPGLLLAAFLISLLAALPDSLRKQLVAEKRRTDWQTSGLDQIAFAELLRTSAYDGHVRRMRLRYRHPTACIARFRSG